MSSLLSVGFLNKGETMADLKCDGKHPLESDKLTIDTIGVTTISIPFQSNFESIFNPISKLQAPSRIHQACTRILQVIISKFGDLKEGPHLDRG